MLNYEKHKTMKEVTLSYDFSGKQNTLFAIFISTQSGTIIFNTIDGCLGSSFYGSFNVTEIIDLQQVIHSLIDTELKTNKNYSKHYGQNALRKKLQWLKDQLTIGTLTKFITDKTYNHIPVFKYDYYNERIKIPLAHVRDFFVEKSTWKYCCPDCNTTGEKTTDKGKSINESIKCTECGCDFNVIC